MQYSEEYVQAVVATGDRLPVSMGEMRMAEEIMDNPVFDGTSIVDQEEGE